MRRTLLLLLASAAVACRSTQPLPLVYPDLPTLRVCDLIRDSDRYHNGLVRVRGYVHSGFEAFVLTDSSCPSDQRAAGMIWLDTQPEPYLEYADHVDLHAYLLAQVRRTAPDFLMAQSWYPVAPVVPVRNRAWSRLHSILEHNDTAVATIVGRFQYSSGGMLRRGADCRAEGFSGFGHMNGFSRRIVIERIESPKYNWSFE